MAKINNIGNFLRHMVIPGDTKAFKLLLDKLPPLDGQVDNIGNLLRQAVSIRGDTKAFELLLNKLPPLDQGGAGIMIRNPMPVGRSKHWA